MTAADDPITGREAEQMILFLRQIAEADSPSARDAALGEAIVGWGDSAVRALAFIADGNPTWREIANAAVESYAVWLGGRRLTTRADEDERRAVAAVEHAGERPGLARLAAEALLELAPSHPLRRARLDPLLDALWAAPAGDPDTRLAQIATLVSADPAHRDLDALVREGEALLPLATDPALARRFRVGASGLFAGRAVAARDEGDVDRTRTCAARARELLGPTDGSTKLAGVLGVLTELDDGPATALEVFLQAVEAEGLDRPLTALQGVLRTGMLAGQPAVVAAHSRETLERLVAQYAEELEPEAAAAHRRTIDRALANIAEACVATGDRELLLWSLETTASARARRRTALRSGRAGARIRRLEAQLWTASRQVEAGAGAPPSVAEGRAARRLTLATRLREEHRRQAAMTPAALRAPDPREVTGRLRADEGVAVLATGTWGTAMLLLRAGGHGVEGEILDKGLRDWEPSLASESTTGWAYVLGAPWEYPRLPGADPRADLDRARDYAEAVVGARLAQWARGLRLRRLWLVAHGGLSLLPWWTVPSITGIDVRQVPALALLPGGRGVATLTGPAVVVGNPTGDLPAADAEAASVAGRLHGRARTELLAGAAATEDAVVAATRGARLLHVCGHAASDLDDETRSALHLHPAPPWATPGTVDELASTARWERDTPDTRVAAVTLTGPDGVAARGLLREQALEAGVVLRHLEYAPTGTLLGVYLDGRLRRLAELWSAGDMAVSGALREVRLAVLSACQSGGSELAFGSSEFSGLPAALRLAGVRSVVCTAWAVDDVVGALTGDLFWELLCAGTERVVDLYAVARQVRARLAGMAAGEAADRVRRLRAAAPPGRSRFLLEAAAARLVNGPATPFAHPYDSAPLFVVGEPLVRWGNG